MDNMSPAYANARQTFAAMSRPLNQMDVASTIAGQVHFAIEWQSATECICAKALSDKTAAQATGFSGATLENTMEPAQLNALNSILKDVQRSTAAQNAGRGVGSDTVQKLAYTNLMEQSGIPTFHSEHAACCKLLETSQHAAVMRSTGAQTRKSAGCLSEVMLDPEGPRF
jgi:hypothetical protein